MSCRRFAPALLACAIAVAGAGSAHAAPRSVVDVLGTEDFVSDSPRGVAVNAATGDIYAVEGAGGDRIRRFSATGTWLSDIGAGGASDLGGRFADPLSVTVDEATGALWAVDTANSRIQRFAPPDAFGTHAFDRAVGWDVTAGGGTGFEVCTAADTCKAGVAGDGDGQFGGAWGNFAGHLAIDPVGGDLFVTDPVNSRVQRFDATTGAHEATYGSAALFGPDSPSGIAFDSTGAFYLADVASDRVLRCHLYGAAPGQLSCTTFAASALSGEQSYAVAVDQTDDHVFVAQRPPAGDWPDATDPIQVAELEADGDVVDVHGAIVTDQWQFQVSRNSALALNPATGAIYLTLGGSGTAGSPRGILRLGDAPEDPAVAALDPVAGITATGATFNGTVTPNGAPAGHRFEYRRGSRSWTSVPESAASAGSGATAVPVTETVTGLEPNTEYEVRLVADRLFGPGDATTDPRRFTTPGVAPAVAGTGAAADDTSAALQARIDPHNAATTFRFEYGPDATYGTRTAARGAGAGGDPVKVVERVTGLQPGTTYHYRVVATNASGTSTGPDRTFTTDGQAPPADRPYELVSPAGGVAELRQNGGGPRPSTADGNHVCISSPADMAGAPSGGGGLADDVYCAHRGSDGWRLEWITAPRGEPGVPMTAAGANMRFLSEDGTRAVFATHYRNLVPNGPPLPGDEGFDSYLRADGTTTWVSRGAVPPNDFRHAAAASADLTHILYLADKEPYEWTPEGVRPVAVDHAGAPATGTLNTGPIDHYGSGVWGVPGTISRDGSRIFFHSDATLHPDDASAGQDVYVREDGTSTRLVSRRTGPANDDGVEFAGASGDGGTAYLHTTGQLTADAISGGAIYRYDTATAALELVEDGVSHALGVSPDGSTVVFAGTNVLDPADGLSLYVARDGAPTARVTALDGGDVGSEVNRVGSTEHFRRALRISADGRVIAFRATVEVDAPADVVSVYRWSAADGLQAVSVARDGEPVDGGFGNVSPDISPGKHINAGRVMTDDGGTVFFETEEPLDPRDTNHDIDVYQWRAGKLRLVSPGGYAGSARYLDNSADGSTVFFTTYERILPKQDINHARDLYAARVGGGFPAPPDPTVGTPPPAQGPVTPPAPPGSDSGAASDGEQIVDPRPRLIVLKPRRAALTRFGAGRRLALRVTLSGGGRVSVRATATVRGKRRTVARGSRRANPTAVVRLRLSKAARRQLRRTGRLRVRIVVSGSRGADPRELTVLVRKQG